MYNLALLYHDILNNYILAKKYYLMAVNAGHNDVVAKINNLFNLGLPEILAIHLLVFVVRCAVHFE